MFPFMQMILQGLQAPEMLASTMATAGITPAMMESQLMGGLGGLAQPQMPQQMPGMASEMAMTQPGAPQAGGPQVELASSSPDIYNRFMGTIQQHVRNPNALAAIAATGQRESGFSPGNAYRTWDDLGKPAGGIMSWRAERLDALRGGREMSAVTPEMQAQYLVNEGKSMGYLDRLEQAQSPTEAMQIMNDAWAFKGYNNPEHPETQARFEAANEFAPQFTSGQGQAGNISSILDFGRAAGESTPTPPITPGGQITQQIAGGTIGGGLDASGTSSTGTTLGAGTPGGQQGPQSLGDKLAKLGAGMKGQPQGGQGAGGSKAPSISGPGPQVGGGFGRNPQSIEQMMALLSAGAGGANVPSLAAMIQPRG